MNKKNTLLFYVFLFLITFMSFGTSFNPLQSNNEPQNSNITLTNPIEDLISKEEWEIYFPYRNGYDINTQIRTGDFFTYEKFKEALENISKYELLIERRCNTNQVEITHINTETGETKVVSVSTRFNAPVNVVKPLVKERVIYKNFLSEGTLTTRKRELAAFLANISHETTGGPEENNTYEWGLFFKDEKEVTGESGDYADENAEYPPVAGKSYHGRGPIQLSYNYNYGPASEHIFGDKNILLSEPELVSTDAAISFMTAIWFWMTPQYPKPSAHDVIVGNWTPTEEDTDGNRVAGLGMTINIINGGVECDLGKPEEKSQVIDRIKYYERYTDILGISTDVNGENECNTCGCASMRNYGNKMPTELCEPENIPSISITEPVDGALIKDPEFISRTVVTEHSTDKGTVTEFKLTIDDAVYYSTNLSWTPRFFKSYLLSASVNINDIPYEDTVVFTIYDDESAVECTNIASWTPEEVYPLQKIIVKHEGKLYETNYYSDGTNNPTTDASWKEIGTCLTNNAAPTLSITSEDKQSYYEIKATAADADSGLFFIDFYVDGELKETYNPRSQLSDVINNSERIFSFIPGAFGKEVLNKTNTVKLIVYDKYGAFATEEIMLIFEDEDNDGIIDFNDQCSNTAAGVEVGEDGCAVALSVDTVEKDLVGIYPNPVKDILTIKTNETQALISITVFNFLGKQVYKKLNSISDHQINLSHLKVGLYIIEFKTTDNTIYKKVLKK